jgi:peptidyl-prolyl cis-trans isomerase D
MFDLFRSRDKAVRILLGAILVVVALSMITYLIPGSGSGMGGGGEDTVIATIGDQKITTLDARKALQNITRGGQVQPQLLAIYAPQVVQSLIADRAMAYEAQRQGIRISDEDVNVAIQNSLPPGYFQDGKLIKKAEFEAALAAQNMTVADLKADTARQLLTTRLRDIALEGTVVAPSEIEAIFRQHGQKAKIEYVIMAPAKYQGDVKTDPAAMKEYYDKNHTQFQVPAKKSISYLVFDPTQMESTIQVTDADLQREYSANLDKFRVPERAHARHILFFTNKGQNEAQVKAKAEALLKQIRAGGDFAVLAKANSEDTGSGAKGGDLGWVTHGQMVKPFEDAVFALKPNEISDLVKTQYGYHIVQVLEKEPAHLRTFEEAKVEIASAYKKQRVNDVMQKAADKAQADFRKDPAHPEKAAADVNQPLQHVDNITAGDPLPLIGVAPAFDQAIGALGKNDVSQPVVLPGNKIAIAVVTGITPAHPASFDESQPQIRQALQGQGLEVILSQKASDLMAKTKENGGDFAKAAKAMGLEVKTSADFDRQGAVEGVGSASSLPDAFTKPVGSVFGPVNSQGNRVVGKIVSRVEPAMADLPAQSAAIRDEIKSRRARERNGIFEDGVRQQLQKDGKIKLHQDVINKLIASYQQS